MWLYLTFLIIIVGSAVADQQHPWEIGNEYHFLIQSRTLTVLDKLASQFSGILITGGLTVQAKSSDTLWAVISNTQYAPVHKVLSEGWDSEITDIEFLELSLSEKTFVIMFKDGVIRDVLIDQNVPTWEVNLLKSIVSQLQIDTQGKNMIAKKATQNYDDIPSNTFKVMEDSVGGKCEVLYNITTLREDVLAETPLIPFPNIRKDGHHIDITKTKNYTRCEQRMAYHSGIVGKMNWNLNPNDGFLSRSSVSRILISGNLKNFTVQSSVTTNKILISSKIDDTYSGAVYSKVNLTLDRISKISHLRFMPVPNNLVSTGNLVYIYNNPFSDQRKPRHPSVNQSSLMARSSESRGSSEESDDSSSSSSSDSRSSSSDWNCSSEYLQPKPKLNEAPESPLLPYFIGYKGNNLHSSRLFRDKVRENSVHVAARLISSISMDVENFSDNFIKQEPSADLTSFVKLVRLIRTMNVTQITELENKSLKYRYRSEEDQKLYNQTSWDVYCNAIAYAGTGPALITIKNLIKNKKLEDIQAAYTISQIPKAAITPTPEYVEAFFELITDEQVKKQKFLNTTAPISFAELVRYTQSNKSPLYYPVYSFGHTVFKHDDALIKTYIPYMATQLREAIKDGDSPRIQTYIMALGNFGHAKILSVFKPYLEGTLPISKFQRLMMVISLNRLSESFPKVARSVAYKIYANVMEAYELRCAAIYVIMKTNPPLYMLLRMAGFQDSSKHVNSAIRTSIETLANSKQPELQDLANKARIAKKLLSPHTYNEDHSRSIYKEVNAVFLNIAQTTILQTIGSSDNTNIFKSVYLDIHNSIGSLNLPSSIMSYTISNIKDIYQMFGPTESKENETIVNIIEKLGIKSEDPEQIEGNIFMDSFSASNFFFVDNHTLAEITNKLLAYVMSKPHGVFEPKNTNYLCYYDMTLAFPIESGLPFIYTLTIPKLTRFRTGGSYTFKNELTQRIMELGVEGYVQISEKIESRIGFVTPFEHRHYIAGIDINSHILIPAGVSLKVDLKIDQTRYELKIYPQKYRNNTGRIGVHQSVVPYTARQDILSFESLHSNNDTCLINTKEPYELKVSTDISILAAKSDLIDYKASQKEGIEALSEIYKVVYNNSAYYKKFNAIMAFTAVQINMTADTFMMYDVNDTEATIPEIFDKGPESEARKKQFLKEVSKNINSTTSFVYDISVLTEHNLYILTLALAESYLDDKSQVLLYWKMQSPNDEKDYLEFCTIGYKQSSRSVPLNYKTAIEKIPKDEFKVEMRFGNCKNGQMIRLKGNWTRTDDAKRMAMKSYIVEKCWKESKQGTIWLPICQKASELIRQKDHLMMSIDTNSDYLYMIANSIIMSPSYSIPSKTMVWKENVEALTSGDFNGENTIDVEIKMPPYNNDTKVFLNTSRMYVTFSLTDIFGKEFNISKILKEYLDRDSEGPMCVLDKTQIVTFDDKVYPLKLENCWHVMMTTYPKRDPNNPEKTLNIPKYFRVIVMARDTDDGSKQIRMILDDEEIHLQQSGDYLETRVNGEIVNFTRRSYQAQVFEIYQLDKMIVIFSLEYEFHAVYDGERILLRPSYKYYNAIRGLCGNFDMQSDNDFIVPKNCILTRAEEFVATYALIEENCQGSVLQNKQKAEQSTCISRSYRPSDVISDREAGKASRRRWAH